MRISLHLAIWIIIFFMTSCQENIDQNLVNNAVQEKILLHKKEYFEKCRKAVLEEASKKVDTLLLNNATLWQTKIDSISRPAKMNKPANSDWKSPLDTAKVKPLFKEKSEK